MFRKGGGLSLALRAYMTSIASFALERMAKQRERVTTLFL